MFTHFTFKQVFSKSRRREWQFSFFFRGQYYKGIYHYNGTIDWSDPQPDEDARSRIESQVHEMMLFHVYDK